MATCNYCKQVYLTERGHSCPQTRDGNQAPILTKQQVQITDKHELQNLLDDYSTDRPYLNAYDCDGGVFADEDELKAWRAKGQILTRAKAIAADEPGDESVVYGIEHAIRIAGLWRAGKMIGGDEDGVRDALLAEVERLRAQNRHAEPSCDHNYVWQRGEPHYECEKCGAISKDGVTSPNRSGDSNE